MREPIAIAYLEDNAEQGSAVIKWLDRRAIQCTVYQTVDTMKEALKSATFDVIMLDVEIAGEVSGLSMLAHIRNTHSNDIPILMVSAKAYWQEALSSGANDFLEKPLNAQKLLVHLDWLLRPVAQEAAIENYPPYQFNANQQLITVEGHPVDLSDDEYELASTLFRHFGKVLSYNQLIDILPSQRLDGSVKKIESDLIKLKRKMNFSSSDGWRIEPVYRHGYRLVNAQNDTPMHKAS